MIENPATILVSVIHTYLIHTIQVYKHEQYMIMPGHKAIIKH